ncbi:hypothetical protein BV898_07421 [Hypsibius exemplaris]|uniref:Ubiquitin-like protease family profile domain-containing protein n=1 Tax=Hypsibius exemplaris TaxID=2072580 RepID=A0A1W0WTS1_HYPEX|nr:hypothetical protein BV898_07421 [Hypsibius exemplaris]
MEKHYRIPKKTVPVGIPGICQSMNTESPSGRSSTQSISRYASVVIDEESSSQRADLGDKATCSNPDIWFGSFQTKEHADLVWTVLITYSRSQQNFYQIRLTRSDETRFNIEKKDLRELRICLQFNSLMLLILPTDAFARSVTSQLQLDLEKNEAFDPLFVNQAAKRLVISLANSSQAEKKQLHRVLTSLLMTGEAGAISEDESLEYLNSASAAQGEIARLKASGTPLYQQPATIPLKKVARFSVRLAAIGIWAAENIQLELDATKGTVGIITDKKTGLQLERDEIADCVYCAPHRIAVIHLSDSCDDSFYDSLERHKFRKGVSHLTETGVGDSTRNLRILFSGLTSDPEPYLEHFNLKRFRIFDDNYPIEVFPKFSAFRREAAANHVKQLNSSQLNSTVSRGNTTMGGKDKTKISHCPTLPLTTPHKRIACPPNPIPPTKRSTSSLSDTSWKKLKPGDTIELDFDDDQENNSRVGVDASNCSSGPTDAATCKSRPTTAAKKAPAASPVFVMPKFFEGSILDRWQEIANERVTREAEALRTKVKSPTPSVATRSKISLLDPVASTSNDCVVLDSSGDEDDEMTINVNVNGNGNGDHHHQPRTSQVDLPVDCHEIFHSLHVFPEVILGNASVMAGDVLQLAKGQQLGDGVMQFMLEVLRLSLNETDTQEIHFMSYFFFQTFLGAIRGVDMTKGSASTLPPAVFARLKDHSKKADLFAFEYLVIPILNEQHWYLVIVCHPDSKAQPPKKPIMVIIDSLHSLGSKDRHKFTCDLIAKWLGSEYFGRKGEHKDFTEKACLRVEPKTPQQANGVDCGVFMYTALGYFIREKWRFENLGQTNAKSITRPCLEKWFSYDDDAIEKIRLKMLDCYYTIAASTFHRFLVYRDDYIPSLIREVGNKTRPNSRIPPCSIVIGESPVKPAKSLAGPKTEDVSMTELSDLTSQTNLNGKDGPRPASWNTLTPPPRDFIQEPMFLAPTYLTPEQLEHWTLTGYQLPPGNETARGRLPKLTPAEKLKAYLRLKAKTQNGEEVCWEPHFVPGRTASQLWAEFMAMKGDAKVPTTPIKNRQPARDMSAKKRQTTAASQTDDLRMLEEYNESSGNWLPEGLTPPGDDTDE